MTDAIRDGHRLSIYLEPDSSQENYVMPVPHYCETYPLVHVCIEDDVVWGAARHGHVMHTPGGPLKGLLTFFYTNALPVYGFCHYMEPLAVLRNNQIGTSLLSVEQYDAKRFVIRPAGDQVWSAEAPSDIDALSHAISDGRPFYGVYTDERGVLRSHPLDLAFVYPELRQICVTFEHALLPEPFISPTLFHGKFRRSIPVDDEKQFLDVLTNKQFKILTDMAFFSAFRRMDRDAAPYGFDGMLTNGKHACKGLKIFAER